MAARVEALLAHYWRDGDEFTAEAMLADWVDALKNLPREAIEAAVASWLQDEPRIKPRPGDIVARAREWSAARIDASTRQATRGARLSDAQERVVSWAVQSGRLGRDDAVTAVAQIATGAFPDWIGEDETQRAVWMVRKHPHCMEPVTREKKAWRE